MDYGRLSFSGYSTNESIILFLEELDGIAAMKGFDAARQREVLEGALRGPAKSAFRAAIADGTIPAVQARL